MSCDLDHVYINFGFPVLRMLHMKFGVYWPCGFRGDDVEHCGRQYLQRQRRRTTEHGYTISSPFEPHGSCELKQSAIGVKDRETKSRKLQRDK